MNTILALAFIGGAIAFLAHKAGKKQERGEELSLIDKGALAIAVLVAAAIAAITGNLF